MPDSDQMMSKQSQMNKEKIKTAVQDQSQAYVTRNTNLLRDKTMGGVTREDVMSKTRASLKQQMFQTNKRSAEVAQEMQQSYVELRVRMRDVLEKTKAATRHKELLKAQIQEEKNREAGNKEEDSANKTGEVMDKAGGVYIADADIGGGDAPEGDTPEA